MDEFLDYGYDYDPWGDWTAEDLYADDPWGDWTADEILSDESIDWSADDTLKDLSDYSVGENETVDSQVTYESDGKPTFKVNVGEIVKIGSQLYKMAKGVSASGLPVYRGTPITPQQAAMMRQQQAQQQNKMLLPILGIAAVVLLS